MQVPWGLPAAVGIHEDMTLEVLPHRHCPARDYLFQNFLLLVVRGLPLT